MVNNINNEQKKKTRDLENRIFCFVGDTDPLGGREERRSVRQCVPFLVASGSVLVAAAALLALVTRCRVRHVDVHHVIVWQVTALTKEKELALDLFREHQLRVRGPRENLTAPTDLIPLDLQEQKENKAKKEHTRRGSERRSEENRWS